MNIIFPVNIRFPMERASAIQIVNMAHAFANNGNNVELIVRKSNNKNIIQNLSFFGLNSVKKLKITRLSVLNTQFSSFMWNWSFIFLSSIYLLVKKHPKESIIYTRSTRKYFIILWIIAKLKGLKIVVEVHQNVLSFTKKDYKNIAKANKIITISKAIKDIISNKLPHFKKRLFVAHSGFNPRYFICNEYKITNKSIINIVYSGGMYSNKGVNLLINAFTRVLTLTKNNLFLKLTLVGGLPYKDDLKDTNNIKKLVNDKGIEKNVSFTGFVEPNKIGKHLNNADILVLPSPDTSNWEVSSPVKFFEYMACGRAIVATKLLSLTEIVKDSDVIFVKPNDEDAMANGLLKAIEKPALRIKIAKRVKKISTSYSFHKRAEQIGEFLN